MQGGIETGPQRDQHLRCQVFRAGHRRNICNQGLEHRILGCGNGDFAAFWHGAQGRYIACRKITPPGESRGQGATDFTRAELQQPISCIAHESCSKAIIQSCCGWLSASGIRRKWPCGVSSSVIAAVEAVGMFSTIPESLKNTSISNATIDQRTFRAGLLKFHQQTRNQLRARRPSHYRLMAAAKVKIAVLHPHHGIQSVGVLNESRNMKTIGSFRLSCLGGIGDSNHLR